MKVQEYALMFFNISFYFGVQYGLHHYRKPGSERQLVKKNNNKETSNPLDSIV